MIYNDHNNILLFVIFGLLGIIILQNFQQNSGVQSAHSAMLEEKIKQRDATLKSYVDANQEAKKNENNDLCDSKSSDGQVALDSDLTYWKDMSEAWKRLYNIYQNTATENAEKLEKCSNNEEELKNKVRELSDELSKKDDEIDNLKYWSDFYRKLWLQGV